MSVLPWNLKTNAAWNGGAWWRTEVVLVRFRRFFYFSLSFPFLLKLNLFHELTLTSKRSNSIWERMSGGWNRIFFHFCGCPFYRLAFSFSLLSCLRWIDTLILLDLMQKKAAHAYNRCLISFDPLLRHVVEALVSAKLCRNFASAFLCSQKHNF